MEKKKVVLPIGMAIINKALADIAWSVEDNPSEQDKKKFYDDVSQELGIDGFLASFTSEGHIGSGDNEYHPEDNPQTTRITRKFYDAFKDLFGDPDGKIFKKLGKKITSPKVKMTRMFRFKSAIINLVQLYLEAELGLNTSAKVKSTNIYKSTSFDYKKRTNETDEEWYQYCIEVEENRYARLFVATIFFVTISDIFLVQMPDIMKIIEKGIFTKTDKKTLNLALADKLKKKGKDINELSPSDKNVLILKVKAERLRKPLNRMRFVEKIRREWVLELKGSKNKIETSGGLFEQEQESMDI